MKYTAKQRVLSKSQEWEPIFMYTNPTTGELNFGIVRLKKTCLYTTLSLRSLYRDNRIVTTCETITFDLPSYGYKNLVGEIVHILKENE